MPENDNPEPTNDPDPSATDDPPENDPGDDIEKMRAALKKANEEAKNYRLRAKELEPLAEKAKELEDAQKTEVDKLKDRIAELEPQTKEAARLRVALRKGLSETQAKRLMGDTEEDLEQDADELLATFAPPDDDEAPAPSRRPRERLKPGAAPDAEPQPSPKELADAVMQRQRGF